MPWPQRTPLPPLMLSRHSHDVSGSSSPARRRVARRRGCNNDVSAQVGPGNQSVISRIWRAFALGPPPRPYTSRQHRPLCRPGGCRRRDHCQLQKSVTQSVDVRRFLDEIQVSVPAELDVHPSLGNSAIRKTTLICR